VQSSLCTLPRAKTLIEEIMHHGNNATNFVLKPTGNTLDLTGGLQMNQILDGL
jgi:hypothetical protein